MDPPSHPWIVVVGAGFGGLWAARRFVRHGLRVIVLDRNNYHTFFPLLYQVAAAELGPGEIAYPIRSLFRREPLVDFWKAELRELDLETRTIVTDGGSLDYDYVVLAPGSVPNFFDVEGAARHSFPLRTMDYAIPLRYHVLACFERVAQASDAKEPGDRRRAPNRNRKTSVPFPKFASHQEGRMHRALDWPRHFGNETLVLRQVQDSFEDVFGLGEDDFF